MRKPNRVVLALAAAVAVASPALAGGKGSTPSSTPPGFGSAGGHNGFESYTSSSTTNGTTTTPTNGMKARRLGRAACRRKIRTSRRARRGLKATKSPELVSGGTPSAALFFSRL